MKGGKHSAYDQILGEVFREERLAKGFSQNHLSELAGVARPGIILFERGERSPTVHVCKALADAMGVPLSRLIRRAEKRLEEVQ